jgi:hypothetical protein
VSGDDEAFCSCPLYLASSLLLVNIPQSFQTLRESSRHNGLQHYPRQPCWHACPVTRHHTFSEYDPSAPVVPSRLARNESSIFDFNIIFSGHPPPAIKNRLAPFAWWTSPFRYLASVSAPGHCLESPISQSNRGLLHGHIEVDSCHMVKLYS